MSNSSCTFVVGVERLLGIHGFPAKKYPAVPSSKLTRTEDFLQDRQLSAVMMEEYLNQL